jgi:hypothetical protein
MKVIVQLFHRDFSHHPLRNVYRNIEKVGERNGFLQLTNGSGDTFNINLRKTLTWDTEKER